MSSVFSLPAPLGGPAAAWEAGTPPPESDGSLVIGNRRISAAQILAIRAANKHLIHPKLPTVKPVSAKDRVALELANRGSGNIDATRTATDPNAIAALRSQFGDPGVVGYHALSALIGPHLAAHVPGTVAPKNIGKSAEGNLLDAALLGPIGKIGRAAKAGVDVLRGAKAARDAEEAAKTVEAAKAVVPHEPPVEPPAEQPLTPEQRVKEALPVAKVVRGKQEAGYSAERSARAGAAETAMQDVGGVAGYKAGLSELKGELPKVNFGKLADLSNDDVESLFTTIQQHPNLQTFQKLHAQSGLLKAIQGQVPNKSEIRLLETVFGKQITRTLPKVSTIKSIAYGLWNVPRSLMASFDLSAPFRQGFVAGTRYPKLFFPNFVHMFKAFGSEKAYQAVMNDVAERPTYGMMQQAKLATTDMEGDLSNREEQFFSNMAEKIPVAGRVVRASGRAYTSFLVKTRADVFDHLIQKAQDQGLDVQNQHFLESVGKFVNSSTGRGDLGGLQHAAVALNSLFFSPRLLASRVNFLNPVYYAKLDPFARKEALKSLISLVGTVGTVLGLAKMGGAQVGVNPESADFAKMKIGDTRIDVLGGFQQPIRLFAQLVGGKVISSTTGDVVKLAPESPGSLSRYDIAQRFIQGKLSPSPALIVSLFKGTDFEGQPLSWKKQAYQNFVPLLIQDVHDLYKDPPPGMSPIEAAVGGEAIGTFGVGLQTYSDKQYEQQLFSKREKTLIHDSKVNGLGVPDQLVIDDLRWKTQLDHQIKPGQTYDQRLKILSKLLDERYGGKDFSDIAADPGTEGKARELYDGWRPKLSPHYNNWNALLTREGDRALDSQEVPATP